MFVYYHHLIDRLKHITELEHNFNKIEKNYENIRKWHEIRSLR